MQRNIVGVLTLGVLSAGVGCATHGGPVMSPNEPPAPRAVQSFTVMTETPAHEAPTASFASGEAPTPTEERPAERAHAETPTTPLILTESQTIEPPPAPASEPRPFVEQDVIVPAVPDAPRPADGSPIDLGAALALVGGRNPEVNFARARVREAYARLEGTEAMWLPHLQAGANYHRHEGNLQNIEGEIVDINRNSLNAGLGTGAVAAGSTTIPGLVMDFHLADAVFGPEIARRAAWASRHAADAELNNQLLNVAVAYLALVEAQQRIAIVQQTVHTAEDLVRVTEDFARSGQGLRADAERAATELQLRRAELLRAEESAAVASARLAALVRLNPAQRLLPLEAVPLPIELVDPTCEPRELVAEALRCRPELRQQQALVEETIAQLRREQYAPLVPSILIGASYSGFGGGIGSHTGSFHDRTDFDAMAFWQIRNLGFGERAARGEATARIDQARFRQLRTMDDIAREVVEAHAQVVARAQQVTVAEQAVAHAARSYDLGRQRIAEAQGLPIEALQALQALDAARQEYLRTVTSYNEAQFRLQWALGWPVREM